MNSLEIFQKLSTGTRLWICGVGSILEAKLRLLELYKAEPADYYACDLGERVVMVAVTTQQPQLHAVHDDAEFFGEPQPQRNEAAWRRNLTLRESQDRPATALIYNPRWMSRSLKIKPLTSQFVPN